MKKIERIFKIKRFINKKGRVTIEELSKQFEVTDETIRRDLKELEEENEIKKVHGGALSLKMNTEDSLHERFYKNADGKMKIANNALKYIQEHSRIYIDFGSTTLAFCEELRQIDNLTIFTNSPLLAKTIIDANSTHIVYILSGKYIANLHQNVGYMTLDCISNEYLDISILSAASLNIKYGFFNFNHDETEVAKAMIKYSKESMILVDDSKVDKNGTWKMCNYSQINYLVCDKYNEKVSLMCDQHGVKYIT